MQLSMPFKARNPRHNAKHIIMPHLMVTSRSTIFLVLIVAIFMFILTLVSTIFINVKEDTSKLVAANENILSVYIPLQQKQSVAAVRSIIDNYSIVNTTNIIDDTIKQELVEPWLGSELWHQTKQTLPIIIEVKLNRRDAGVIMQMTNHINSQHKNIIIDDHQKLTDDDGRIISVITYIAWAIVMILCIAFIGVITLTIHMNLFFNSKVIKNLNLIGATNHFISKEFEKFILKFNAVGMGIGIIVSIITLVLLNNVFAGSIIEISIFPEYGWQWLFLVSIPIVALLSAVVVTRVIVAHHVNRRFRATRAHIHDLPQRG